jgi:3-dehydroquinate dehydratase-1
MKGSMIGEGDETLVCTSLVAATRTGLLEELAAVLARKPDVIEWRADFFEKIADTDAVIGVARSIKEIAPGTTAIFTVRSVREGGQPIPLTPREVIELTAAVCSGTTFEYVDCELSNAAEAIVYLRQAARASGTRIIGSYHNFDRTPSAEVMHERIAEAERCGLDVAKVAVMPHDLRDVLTLLGVTLEAREMCSIPLITMSMGSYGALTRMVGGVFGSSLTFAVGLTSSAPGQIPIEDVRTVLEIVRKTVQRS